MSDGYQIRNQNAIHFLTFQVVFWVDLFTRDSYRNILLNSLSYCRNFKNIELFAYVIMSNHMHLVCRRNTGLLSDFVRDYKKFTSYECLKEIQSQEHYESRRDWLLDKFSYAANRNFRNSNYQIWTHENHPVELTSNYMIDQRIAYTHNNPVKANIVEEPHHYLHSSARNYAGLKGLIEIDFI